MNNFYCFGQDDDDFIFDKSMDIVSVLTLGNTNYERTSKDDDRQSDVVDKVSNWCTDKVFWSGRSSSRKESFHSSLHFAAICLEYLSVLKKWA